MITSSQLKEKALKKYPAYLQGLIERKPFERIVIPCDKRHSNILKEYQSQLDDLQSLSKERKGYGYTISWVQINSKALGNQDFPQEIFFATEGDFLKFLKKEKEVAMFLGNINLLLTEFPQLKGWAMRYPMKVVEADLLWSDIIKVLRYFRDNPKPNLYIRQLPIEVHTKFIESNKSLLRELLDNIIGDYVNQNESNFERRFNLKYVQPLIRMRILDDGLAHKFFNGLNDLTFPIESLPALSSASISFSVHHSDSPLSSVRNIFIVENKVNFLTFPKIDESIIIWGSGYGIANLKGLEIPSEANIYYWGDLDAQGFEILSQFRGIFPRTKSLLMDTGTFEQYFENDSGSPSAVSVQLNLTPNENELYNKLKQNNWRLEQEKIPQKRLIEELKNLGLQPQ